MTIAMAQGSEEFWSSIFPRRVAAASLVAIAVGIWLLFATSLCRTESCTSNVDSKIETASRELSRIADALVAERESSAKQFTELNARLQDLGDKLGQTKIDSSADVKRIADHLAQIEQQFEAANRSLSKIQTSAEEISGSQSAASKMAALQFIREITLTAVKSATSPGVKDEITKAGIHVAENVASSFLGAAAKEVGAALGKWITCPIGNCQSEEADIIKAVEKSKTDHCGKECIEAIGKLADSIRNFSTASLEQTILKLGDADNASRAKLTKAVHKLSESLGSISGGAPGHDLIVVSVEMPEQSPAGGSSPTPVPAAPDRMSVYFETIGSVDDNGQSEAITPRLKEIVRARKNCTISVAGHADALGADQSNLVLSQRRAHVIADKLKAALAGEGVQIEEAAWGERRLQVWTSNNMPNRENRRVDIRVRCSGGLATP